MNERRLTAVVPSMWFPYSLPVHWKAESEHRRIDASLADETEREFLVGFYLHNRITHDWEVELQLEKSHWVTDIEQGRVIRIGYYPNESSQLTEIICRTWESTAAVALRRCHARVSRILSFWSATKGRGFAILGFRVADLEHDARWRALPHRLSAESFELPACEALPKSYWTTMALYRDARNSPSDMYRLLCCYKIVRLWAERAEPFNLLQERGLDSGHALVACRVTQEMLVLSGLKDFRPELEGLHFSELPRSLAAWHDRAMSALSDDTPPPALDDYEQSVEFASVANLADLAAHHILAREIKGWRSITEVEQEPAPMSNSAPQHEGREHG